MMDWTLLKFPPVTLTSTPLCEIGVEHAIRLLSGYGILTITTKNSYFAVTFLGNAPYSVSLYSCNEDLAKALRSLLTTLVGNAA